MGMDHEGTVTITRREFIKTIEIQEGTTIYLNQINPGYEGTFPWLSGFARSWQQYRFKGLAVEYVPTSGFAVGNTNAALGQIAMAFKYNVVESGGGWPIFDLPGLLNMNGSVSMSPAAPGTCYMECKPEMSNQPTRFVYTGEPLYPAISTPLSQQNFDAANLLILTQGAQNQTRFQAGQLWVTYHVELYQPRTVNPTPPPVEVSPAEKLAREYAILCSYTGPFDPEALIKIEGRKAELLAYFQSLDFVSQVVKLREANQLAELKHEDEPPAVDPSLLKYLQTVIDRQHKEDVRDLSDDQSDTSIAVSEGYYMARPRSQPIPIPGARLPSC